jgi:3-keto-disaccharide hydrolase
MRKIHSLFAGTLLCLLALGSGCASRQKESSGYKTLFNGKDLSGWDGDPRFWSVKDGVIVGQTTAETPAQHNTFLFWKNGKVSDFELHASFKITNHNSGIQYRSADEGDHIASGYQADIDGANKYTGILYEERKRGILATRGQKVVIDESGKKQITGSVGDPETIVKAIKPNDWNNYVIVAQGNHLVQKINGVTTVDVTDNETGKSAREGFLALQIHAGPPMKVEFKNIQLRELKSESKPTAP